MVADQLYFGDSYSFGQDAITFTFGCVSKETNLFYDQLVDGILGMGMKHKIAVDKQLPIYDAMISQNIT